MAENLTQAIKRAKDYVSKLTSDNISSSDNIDLNKVWQLDNSYIASSTVSGLVIIDQARAHQRILFDDAVKSFKLGISSSQTLLFPKELKLSSAKLSTLLDILPFMNKIGFTIRKLENKSIVLESIPSDMPWGDEDSVISKMLNDFSTASKKDFSNETLIALSFSKRACIKHGDVLNVSEMIELINRLFGTDEPFITPNQEPILYQIEYKEIKKRFNELGL